MRTFRRVIAIVVMAAALLIGTSAASGAGELCVRARLADPLQQIKLCGNTNPQI